MIDAGAVRTHSGMLANFRKMAVAFSVNHGAVVAILNLSVILLGDHGSYQSAALYLTYAITALFFSTGLLELMGPRSSLILGSSLYCIYILSVPAALLIPQSMPQLGLAVALAGGTIGGFAAGFLWAAQGTYFALNAKLHAVEAGLQPAEANSQLAAVFAVIYLGFEVTLKLLPEALSPLNGIRFRFSDGSNQISLQQVVVTSVYAVLAILAVFGLLAIKDLRPEMVEARAQFAVAPVGSTEDDKAASLLYARATKPSMMAKATAAVRLWCKKPSVLLLAPIQITFGVSASLLGYQVTGSWLKSAFGEDRSVIAGSLFSALVALIAGLLQVPFKRFSGRFGKPPVMLLGLVAFLGLALVVLSSPSEPTDSPGTWITLVSCYLLQGIGRACYEGTNKALYADFFPHDSSAAFSNIVLANGVASSVSFFSFPSLSEVEMATVVLVCASATIVSYILAEFVHRRG